MGYIILIVLYLFTMTGILMYCLLQLVLAYHYLRSKMRLKAPPIHSMDLDDLPFVTIQLPIYNEMYVADRLIQAICQINYPKNRLEIQVLDDSTDETVDIVEKVIEDYIKQGFDIKHIRREIRTGYKAGALQNGMMTAKGEFLAIFDADFIPSINFLFKTLPYFKDPKTAVVQTKWEHLNKNYSLLTRVQAFALDVHFTVEQSGRNSAGYFINFNGTAGIWRKTSIIDAGGWSADTLTEDLDLSYRAQLKGWKFKYLEDVGSPAELPSEIQGLKTQQYRWNKGGAETARKIIPKILKSKSIPFGVKCHAISHLLNSSVYILVFLVALLSFPMVFFFNHFSESTNIQFLSFYYLATIAISLVFFVSVYSTSVSKKRALPYYLVIFPLFLSFSMGLSLHNAIAVLKGYLGIKSPFHRTPKFNIKAKEGTWIKKKYISGKIRLVTILEGFFILYFISAIVMDIEYGNTGMLPIHILATAGFSMVFYFSVRQHILAVEYK